MVETKRIAAIAASVIEGLRQKELTPFEIQEVLLVAIPLAQIEVARAQREAQQRLMEIQQAPWPPSKDVKYEPQLRND